MAFNGKEGEFITIQEGAEMTTAFREAGSDSTKAVFFGREKIQEILDQADCMGIRMYFAENVDKQKTLVLVGATADGNDQTEGKILDRGRLCPIYCSTGNGLNS